MTTTPQEFEDLSNADSELILAVRGVDARGTKLAKALDTSLALLDTLRSQGQDKLAYGDEIKLRLVASSASEAATTLETQARALTAVAEKAAAAVPGLASGADQVQKVAKGLFEKDPALTPAAAVSKAMQLRPDLVQQDRVERGVAH
jgi:hypothetical protein